ncbi:MAG: endonuclease/exonuclease/phosphatase family protein [Saprospiraceae bacterium]
MLALLLLSTYAVYGQPFKTIHELQGSGAQSPFLGQNVTADSMVVTAVGTGFAFAQTFPGREDDNPVTSEGIMLFDLPTGNLNVGDLVRVSGLVREIDELTALSGPDLQLTLLATGQPLPPATALGPDFPSPLYTPFPDLERVEAMRVSFDAAVGGPSNGFEAYVYLTPDRPFREPGIEVPGPAALPTWDGNPELIRFDPDLLGAVNNRFLSAGDVVSGTAILLDTDRDEYRLAPVGSYSFTPNPDLVRAARQRLDFEVTVGSINVLFFETEDENYPARLRKLADYIEDQMQLPDIVAIQEIGGATELTALANRLRQQNPAADYRTYFGEGIGDLSTAFLVAQRLGGTPTVQQLGTNQTLSIGGILHDRPPLLLTLTLPDSVGTVLNVMNLHLRSLGGVEGSSANFVRTKRYEQSISVAEMVQERIDDNLVLVGDFNAFQFTDGYVDVVNQIAGLPGLGAQRPVVPIVSPPLRIITAELPPEERYSFVFGGSAQLLDQALATQLSGLTIEELQFVRGNADAAEAFMANEFIPQRVSDHDGFVLYLGVDGLVSARDELSSSPRYFTPVNPLPTGTALPYSGLPRGSRAVLYDILGRAVSSKSLDAGDGSYAPPITRAGWYTLVVTYPGGGEVVRFFAR